MNTDYNSLSSEQLLYLKIDIYFLAKRFHITLHYKDTRIKWQHTTEYLGKVFPPHVIGQDNDFWDRMFSENDFTCNHAKQVPFMKSHLMFYYLDHKKFSTAKTAHLLKMSPNTLQKLKKEGMPIMFLTQQDRELAHFYDDYRRIKTINERFGLTN